MNVASRRAMSVGRDMAGTRILPPSSRKLLPALLVGLLLGGLALAALRVDLIRVRYGLAAAMSDEKELGEERHTWIARVRELRDPTRLSGLAAERGFERPGRVIEVPASGPAAGQEIRP